MLKKGSFLESWNGLKLFTLFVMGKIYSVFEQIAFRTAFWNGLWSRTEVGLYLVFCNRIKPEKVTTKNVKICAKKNPLSVR